MSRYVGYENPHTASGLDGVAGAGTSQGWLNRVLRVMGLPGTVGGFSRLRPEGDVDDEAGPRSSYPSPEENASILSHLFFNYINPLMAKGAKHPLEHSDLWDMAHRDRAGPISQSNDDSLKSTTSPQHPNGDVLMSIRKQHGTLFAWMGVLKVVHDLIMFAQPMLLSSLLHHLAKHGHSKVTALWLAVGMLLTALAEVLTINIYFHVLYRISLHLKTQMVGMIYTKSLRITSAAKSALGQGSIVNLQSNDAAKIWALPLYLHIIWNGPFQILCVVGLLVRIMGWLPSLAGLVTTMLLVPSTMLLGKQLGTIRRSMVKATDERVKMASEIVTGIKAIKLYAWEGPYVQRISELREQELKAIRATQILSNANMALFTAGPVLVALAAFTVYAATGEGLTAGVAFPALALFNLLRFPIIMLPSQVLSLINARVGIQRIQKFMDADEMEAVPTDGPGDSVVSVRDGSFAWDKEGAALVKGLSLEVKKGQLVIIVGQVGSGKSSVLGALLGEMHKISGSVHVAAGRAYTSQEPWIQNATLRSNVLLGRDYQQERYCDVIMACALTPDLEMLPAGDLTEIGEKGVNLSGGQKHRVALARACYQEADVYLLDDPLSAVDAHVGRHLFEECICGLLAGKTRILVTHQLQFLPAADMIVVMDGGRVAATGTLEQLMRSGLEIQKFVSSGQANDKEMKKAAADGAANGAMPKKVLGSELDLLGLAAKKVLGANGTAANGEAHVVEGKVLSDRERLLALLAKLEEEKGKLVKVEERAKGQVQNAVYLAYLSRWGPFFAIPAIIMASAMLERGMQVGQNWTLSKWSNSTVRHENKQWSYMLDYFIMGIGSIGVQACRLILLVFGSISASRALHHQLLDKVVRLPMSFFDSQPTGRLLNRFTKDTEAVDIAVSGSVNGALITFVNALWSIVVVLIIAPFTAFFLVPLAALYYQIQQLYVATSRELKRLDSLAFSPIFSHFGESLSGLMVIRAFGKQTDFLARNERNLDHSNKAYWPMQVVNRWLSVRLELMGAGIVFSSAVFVSVLTPQNSGLAGLALTSALNLTGIMNWMVRQTTELEVSMNSVERLLEYSKVEEEAAAHTSVVPPKSWPQEGRIEVQGLWLRYREGLDPVLRDLNFIVEGGQKVGVCGRTGCGKSSLMMALYRIVEPYRGRVVIDAVDTNAIGLTALRSKLSLVPQDPVIFSGSVRSNLDPFREIMADHFIWEALKRAGLETMIKDMGSGLDSMIKEGGSNLSVGQRQLLCMARALLRASKILILDEATSNVDNQTDALIQRTIRVAFRSATVLTIAHRLHTIMDSDRILLLDRGRLEEYASPQELLTNPSSRFSAMVGEVNKSHISHSASTQQLAAQDDLMPL